MSEPAFDRLLRRLTEAEVEFILIGGLALGAWGVVRGTKDVDVVVASDPANLDRLATLAVELGGHVHAGESFLSSQPSIGAQLRSGEQVAIETELGRLDVVQGLEGVPAYEDLRRGAVMADVLGVEVAICSVEDLREMKKAAGRTGDLADLEGLDAIEG